MYVCKTHSFWGLCPKLLFSVGFSLDPKSDRALDSDLLIRLSFSKILCTILVSRDLSSDQ